MSKTKSLPSSEKFDGYVSSVKDQSENIVRNVFPEKIAMLDKLLKSDIFSADVLNNTFHQKINIPVPDPQAIKRAIQNGVAESETPPAVKKRKIDNRDATGDNEHVDGIAVVPGKTQVLALPSGPVPCNDNLVKLIDICKPEIRQLVEHSNLLKMWVTFLIPKIEDGNNFGVSIQEDTLGEIRSVEVEAATFYEQISRYHMTRAKVVSKIAKYPHIEDYRRVVHELDEKEFLSLRITLSEVRNHYAALYDLIVKNWEKIIKPRSSNADSLY